LGQAVFLQDAAAADRQTHAGNNRSMEELLLLLLILLLLMLLNRRTHRRSLQHECAHLLVNVGSHKMFFPGEAAP
jgi:hypothetical protein